jgi:hypothetical protein
MTRSLRVEVSLARRSSPPAVRCLLLAACLLASPRSAEPTGLRYVEGYRFIIPEVTASPGSKAEVKIQGEHEKSAQGFSLAARYPSSRLTIERIHIRGTILEAIQIDFFEARIDPAQGFFTAGVLVDSRPPFEGSVIPNINQPLTFLRLDVTVAEEADEDLVLRLEDGLSSPPIQNLYVVDNKSVPVTELGEGRIRLPFRQVEAFLRGDANLDGARDISDAVSILRYGFGGGAPLGCMDAGDTNADSRVDISDAIFLLDFLYKGGRPPPPPSEAPGPNPGSGGLGCAQPLFFLRSR